MTIQAPRQFTLAEFMAAIQQGKPNELPNLVRTMRLIVPAIADPRLEPPVDDDTLYEVAPRIQAQKLLDCLTADDRAWAPWLVAAVPELGRVPAYKNDYRRCLMRCLKHARSRGLMSAASRGVAPAWQDTRALLAAELPYTRNRLAELLEAGHSEYYGLPLARKTEKTTQTYFRTMLDGINAFGRYMTSQGVLRPQDVQPENFSGTEASWYAECRRRNPQAMTQYYRTCAGWEVLRQLKPDWNLAAVPDAWSARRYGISPDTAPELIKQLVLEVETIVGQLTKSRHSVDNYQNHLLRLSGFLENHCGYDINALCSKIEIAEDLAFLLGAGFPESPQGRSLPPDEEVRRVFDDDQYRDELLTGIRQANKRRSASADCRANPILLLYQDWTLKRERASVLEVGLRTTLMVNLNYLRIQKTQLDWLRTMRSQCKKAMKRQHQSPRARRKMIAGTDRDLWHRLVGSRNRLTAHTQRLKKRLENVNATPERTEAQLAYARMRWAVAVRDELMIGFLLAFHLRKENLQGLKLGETLLPDEYRIILPPRETKSGKPIIKTFPDKGTFADLKGLLDVYLEEARPILLGDREPTPYCFLSVHRGWGKIVDQEGNERSSRQHLNRVVETACRRHFPDILPPGLSIFNAHMARDLFVNYVHGKTDAELLIMQALNNSPEVAQRHYNNVDRNSDDAVRAFLENLDVSDLQESRSDKHKRRQNLRRDVERLLGPSADVHTINRIMGLFEQHR